MRAIRIGTRGSALALAQAHWLQAAVQRLVGAPEPELVVIRTSGDRFVDRPLRDVGGKGLFVKEIEEALLDGGIDCAIHSMKDVPAELPPGLHIAAVPSREDVRDVLISRSDQGLSALATGATVGTCSLRRSALLHACRPDLKILELRGNVDTRLRRLEEGLVDAILLAAAGLHRLGLSPEHAEYLDPTVFPPAIGQGALAIETRDDDIGRLLAQLEDPASRLAVTAERAFLAAAGGSCHTPIAARTELRDGTIRIDGLIASPDGTRVVRGQEDGTDAHAVGTRLGERLLSDGGAAIIAALELSGGAAR